MFFNICNTKLNNDSNHIFLLEKAYLEKKNILLSLVRVGGMLRDPKLFKCNHINHADMSSAKASMQTKLYSSSKTFKKIVLKLKQCLDLYFDFCIFNGSKFTLEEDLIKIISNYNTIWYSIIIT